MACSNVKGAHRVLCAVATTRLSDMFDQIFFLRRDGAIAAGRSLSRNDVATGSGIKRGVQSQHGCQVRALARHVPLRGSRARAHIAGLPLASGHQAVQQGPGTRTSE